MKLSKNIKKWLRVLCLLILFIFLTLLTQIGGVVLLLSLFISKKLKWKIKAKPVLIFTGIYLITTFLIIPLIAPLFGRTGMVNSNHIKPVNYMTVVLNRNYVVPEMNKVLQRTGEELSRQGIRIHYLDANFPFFNGFPLFPHLSHNDGKKIDLSFVYEDQKGVIFSEQKSISGYGVFESPRSGELDQISICKNKGYFQYGYPKYLTFGSINEHLKFSEKGTRDLIICLLEQPELQKLFIEPHLRTRLNLDHPKVRYHGCRAVRHDDHIHVQIK